MMVQETPFGQRRLSYPVEEATDWRVVCPGQRGEHVQSLVYKLAIAA